MSSKLKKILIAQAEPKDENSPYPKLAKEFGLEFVFRSFVEIQGLSTSEFRKQNVNPLDFSAVIFTGRLPVDHFFRICKDLRVEMPPETKYFCMGEATAKYLQKYITIRKRKLFVTQKANPTATDLIELMSKHSDDNYVYPCGDAPRADLLAQFARHNFKYKVARVYDTVPVPLNDLDLDSFYMVCLFAPNAIEALKASFPDFKPGRTLIAVFGKNTLEAAQEASLQPDIVAPTPEAPSMTMAIENYLRAVKK